jgi:hypothetical protein
VDFLIRKERKKAIRGATVHVHESLELSTGGLRSFQWGAREVDTKRERVRCSKIVRYCNCCVLVTHKVLKCDIPVDLNFFPCASVDVDSRERTKLATEILFFSCPVYGFMIFARLKKEDKRNDPSEAGFTTDTSTKSSSCLASSPT